MSTIGLSPGNCQADRSAFWGSYHDDAKNFNFVSTIFGLYCGGVDSYEDIRSQFSSQEGAHGIVWQLVSLLNLFQLSMDLQLCFAAIILTTEDSWLCSAGVICM